MKKEEAINLLIQVAKLAQRGGLLSLEDAAQTLVASRIAKEIQDQIEQENAPVVSRINAATGGDTSTSEPVEGN